MTAFLVAKNSSARRKVIQNTPSEPQRLLTYCNLQIFHKHFWFLFKSYVFAGRQNLNAVYLTVRPVVNRHVRANADCMVHAMPFKRDVKGICFGGVFDFHDLSYPLMLCRDRF